jgi:integrase
MPYKEGDCWRGVVTRNGKRHTKQHPTKKAALTWESEKRKELIENEKQQQRGTDLLTFSTKYLDYAQRFSKLVYDEKRSVARRIIKVWGSEQIADEITPEMAEQYLNTQKAERSANAANRDRKNLLTMWKRGVEVYGIKSNPWKLTDKFPHDRSPQYTPPTQDVLKLLSVATRKERVFLYSYIFTGARRSEIFRWLWDEDINFERRQYRLGTRKTSDGSMEYEWFPMPDELYTELRWWWDNRTIKNSPYVFTDDQKGPHYGKPYNARRRFMRGLCKRAKVTQFGFHALRRFFASRLADSGKATTKTIQRFLRHKNLRTTEIYIQNINDDLAGITDGLLDNITQKSSKAENDK